MPSLDEENVTNKHNKDEEFLSNHTISMRRALEYCRELLKSRPLYSSSKLLNSSNADTAKDAWNAANSIPRQRKEALEEFAKDSTFAVVDFSEELSILDFRKRYLLQNRPCVIRGMNHSRHFSNVSSLWTTFDSKVNIEWFLENVGEGAIVPVRQESTSTTLDDEGRANECSTIEMPLREWCSILSTFADSSLYLKDWHFQKWWETINQACDPLYSVPPLFRNDLLNNLLLRVTDGDYRFVYWGPPQSQTPLHSDVLHSFSWSYNVCGEKKWTFYIPNSSEKVELHQYAGELVFVPSTWKHKVENVVETLSINHNWITTANIDLTWQCLSTEMTSVDDELSKWNSNDGPSWEAKELMLRGCVGLDVSAFFFMIIMELLELLTRDASDEEQWEAFFDMFRLDAWRLLVLEPQVHLKERLAAVLESDDLTIEAFEMLELATKAVDEVKTYYSLDDESLYFIVDLRLAADVFGF